MSFEKALREMDQDLLIRAGVAARLKSWNSESAQSMVDEHTFTLTLVAEMVEKTILPPEADEQVEDMDVERIRELVDPDPRAYIIGAKAALNCFMSILVEYAALEQMRQHFPDSPD
jgi:hypothetical protein